MPRCEIKLNQILDRYSTHNIVLIETTIFRWLEITIIYP